MSQLHQIANLVGLISANRHQFQKIFQNAEDYTRAEIAMKVIKPFTEHWKMNVLVNSVLDSFEDMNHVDETLLKATQFFKTCDRLELDDIYNEKMLVNGKELMSIMNRKPGAWMKKLNDYLKVWQYNHQGCTKEDMLKHIETLKDTF
ncbi:unnamed protein product [Ambrosiozyma monospora]|uniref:Unnamed protein product n=1 Tax=Ambrosiozyma monospora TaxID=43982 RepID=A0A9W6YWE1_AMBMO|nr:unnamed protein product [Ambrosiozyma monospora]